MSASSPRGRGEVRVEPIAAAVAASGASHYVIALRLGWEYRQRGRVYPDSHRVKRRLGLIPINGRLQQHMDYATAAAITRAAGLDPVEVGL